MRQAQAVLRRLLGAQAVVDAAGTSSRAVAAAAACTSSSGRTASGIAIPSGAAGYATKTSWGARGGLARRGSPPAGAAVNKVSESERATQRYKEEYLLDEGTAALGPESLNRFLRYDKDAVPEAFQSQYPNAKAPPTRPLLTGEGKELRAPTTFKLGCKGLQAQFEFAGEPYVLARYAMLDVWALLNAPGKEGSAPRILLNGHEGSGKSVLLASMVEKARKEGWLVMYIPTMKDVTEGDMFSKNDVTGLFDTPVVAQTTARFLLQAHADRLAELPAQRPGAEGTLEDLANRVVSSEVAAESCAAFLDLVAELTMLPASEKPLIAMDEYNALYFRTHFREWVSDERSRPLEPRDLTLGRGLQLLEKRTGGAAVLAATTCTRPISARAWLTTGADVVKYTVPPLDQDELARLMTHYALCDLLWRAPTEAEVWRALDRTAGNGHRVRKLLPVLLDEDEDDDVTP